MVLEYFGFVVTMVILVILKVFRVMQGADIQGGPKNRIKNCQRDKIFS